jgi:hypothetical protein
MNRDQVVQLHVSYMKWPQASGRGFEYGEAQATKLSLKLLIAAFFALSFLFQAVPALFLWDSTWKRLTEKGIQPYRWVEYSFSASCLILVVASLNGITDFHFLLVIFATMWTVMMLGLVQENTAYYVRELYLSLGDTRVGTGFGQFCEFVLPHLIGWVPYTCIWFVLFRKFVLSNKHGCTSAPQWVFAFYAFNISIFSSFGINQLAQMCRLFKLKTRPKVEKEKNSKRLIAVQHEFVYVFLSASAKVVTAVFLFAGVLANKSAGSLENSAALSMRGPPPRPHNCSALLLPTPQSGFDPLGLLENAASLNARPPPLPTPSLPVNTHRHTLAPSIPVADVQPTPAEAPPAPEQPAPVAEVQQPTG